MKKLSSDAAHCVPKLRPALSKHFTRISILFIAAQGGIPSTVSFCVFMANAEVLGCASASRPDKYKTVTDMTTVCFSAATVLLAACKCPDVAVTVGDPSFERDWARCLYILHHYEDQIASASQAIQVLEVMKQSVSGNGHPSQRKSKDLPYLHHLHVPFNSQTHSHASPTTHTRNNLNAAPNKPPATAACRSKHGARLLYHAYGSSRRQSLHAWHGQHERCVVWPAAPQYGLA
jgi:hypothetical protein